MTKEAHPPGTVYGTRQETPAEFSGYICRPLPNTGVFQTAGSQQRDFLPQASVLVVVKREERCCGHLLGRAQECC